MRLIASAIAIMLLVSQNTAQAQGKNTAERLGYPRDSSRCHPSGAARTIFRTCCLVSTEWTSTSAPSKKTNESG